MPHGGHFAAMEQPELLVEDIRKFARPVTGQLVALLTQGLFKRFLSLKPDFLSRRQLF